MMSFTPLFPFVSALRWRAGSFVEAAFVAAAALLLASAACAADKPLAGSAPKSKDPVISQAQLRECLAHKEALGQRNESALKTKADVTAAKTEIDRTGVEIAASQATLDRTNKDEVDTYNARIVARNALIDDYQAKAEAFNKEAEAIKTAQDSYNSACGNRRYDDRDLADIQRKK